MLTSTATRLLRALVVAALLAPATAWPHAQHGVFGKEGAETRRTVHVGLPQNMAAHAARLITTEPALHQERTATLRTDGRVAARPDRIHEVTINTGGEVRQVFIRQGQRIAEGDPVVAVYSPDFILTQRSHLALLEDEVRLEQIRTLGNLPDYLADARENLIWWGMTEAEVDELVEQGEVKEVLTARSPVSGIVAEVMVEPGALINAGDKGMSSFVVTGAPVARIVPDDALWAEGRAFPDRLDDVRAGQKVRMRVGNAVRWYSGEVVQVDPIVDPGERRGRFYARFDYFPAEYGLGAPLEMRVETHSNTGVWVPDAAILTIDRNHYVYVQKAVDIYERRFVGLGARDQGWVQVVEGVESGEAVVVGGTQLLEGKRLIGTGARGDDHHH